MRTNRSIPAVLLAGTLLAGCSGAVEELVERGVEEAIEQAVEAEGGGEVDIDLGDGDGSFTVETSEGTVSFGASDDVPESFPDSLPLPEDGTVLSNFESTAEGVTSFQLILEYPGASYEDLVDEIRSGIEAGFTVVSDSNSNFDGNSVTTLTFEGDWQGAITVADDGEGTVSVSYTVSQTAE